VRDLPGPPSPVFTAVTRVINSRTPVHTFRFGDTTFQQTDDTPSGWLLLQELAGASDGWPRDAAALVE